MLAAVEICFVEALKAERGIPAGGGRSWRGCSKVRDDAQIYSIIERYRIWSREPKTLHAFFSSFQLQSRCLLSRQRFYSRLRRMAPSIHRPATRGARTGAG